MNENKYIEKNINNIKKQITDIINKKNDHNKQVDLVAVSKYTTVEKMQSAIDYGIKVFGENKIQDAMVKIPIIKQNNPNIKFHMIGKLQSNKVKKAIELFDVIQTVDNLKLAKLIARNSAEMNKIIEIYLQVNTGSENQKNGVLFADFDELYQQCLDLNLNIAGVMAIPTMIQGDGGQLIPPVAEFKQLSDLQKKYNLKTLSMGMSNDYISAIEHGSNMVRIGSSIFNQQV